MFYLKKINQISWHKRDEFTCVLIKEINICHLIIPCTCTCRVDLSETISSHVLDGQIAFRSVMSCEAAFKNNVCLSNQWYERVFWNSSSPLFCKNNAIMFVLNPSTLKKLESLNQYPDFNNYLIFVLTKLKKEGKL